MFWQIKQKYVKNMSKRAVMFNSNYFLLSNNFEDVRSTKLKNFWYLSINIIKVSSQDIL